MRTRRRSPVHAGVRTHRGAFGPGNPAHGQRWRSDIGSESGTDPRSDTSGSGATPRVRLLIQADDGPAPSRRGIASLLRHLRAPFARLARIRRDLPLTLRIEDARGRCVFALDNASALTHVELPPGMYEVTACRGDQLRRYALTLAGQAFNLRLFVVPGPK